MGFYRLKNCCVEKLELSSFLPYDKYPSYRVPYEWVPKSPANSRSWNSLSKDEQVSFLNEFKYSGTKTYKDVLLRWNIDWDTIPNEIDEGSNTEPYDKNGLVNHFIIKGQNDFGFPKQNKVLSEVPLSVQDRLREIYVANAEFCEGGPKVKHKTIDYNGEKFLEVNFLLLSNGLGHLSNGLPPWTECSRSNGPAWVDTVVKPAMLGAFVAAATVMGGPAAGLAVGGAVTLANEGAKGLAKYASDNAVNIVGGIVNSVDPAALKNISNQIGSIQGALTGNVKNLVGDIVSSIKTSINIDGTLDLNTAVKLLSIKLPKISPAFIKTELNSYLGNNLSVEGLTSLAIKLNTENERLSGIKFDAAKFAASDVPTTKYLTIKPSVLDLIKKSTIAKTSTMSVDPAAAVSKTSTKKSTAIIETKKPEIKKTPESKKLVFGGLIAGALYALSSML